MKFDPSAFRIAVCQLHFHPATTFRVDMYGKVKGFRPLQEPVYGAGAELEAILGELDLEQETHEEELKRLQSALASQYCKSLEPRVRALLQECRLWDADLVVFPEFSIPGELLLALKEDAAGMLVAFGSHTVSSSLIQQGLYTELGWTNLEEDLTVAPVLTQEGRWRTGLRYRSGKALLWDSTDSPIPLPGGHTMMVVPGDPWGNEKVPSDIEERFRSDLLEAALLVGPMLQRHPKGRGNSFYLANYHKKVDAHRRPTQTVVTCPEVGTLPFVTSRAADDIDDPFLWDASRYSSDEGVLLVDVSLDLPKPPRKIMETKLVSPVELAGRMDLIQAVNSSDEDIKRIRTTIEQAVPQLRQWRKHLVGNKGNALGEWRQRLRLLLQEYNAMEPQGIREALAGYTPLPKDCPTSTELELGLLRATHSTLARWMGVEEALEAQLSQVQSWIDKLRGDATPGMGFSPEPKSKAPGDAPIVGLIAKRVLVQAGFDATPREPVLPTVVPTPVVLHEIHLKNIGPFTEARLTAQRSPDEGQWIVLLGENGEGKSTILRALALALATPNLAISAHTRRDSPYIRWEATEGHVGVSTHLRSHGKFAADLSLSTPWGAIKGSESLALTPREGERTFPLFAYGSQRGTALGGPKREVSFESYLAIETLFSKQPGMVHAKTWLGDLSLAAEEKPEGPDEHFFLSVRRLLCKLLPKVTDLTIESGDVWVHGIEPHPVTLTQLSDGYLTTLGWVVDLIARWSNWAKERNVPVEDDFHLKMTGIVLLDEIDLHLHPRWQCDVIQTIRDIFPRMTFVVTTHSPLVLFGAKKGEIFVLRRDPDSKSVVVEPHDIENGARVDQLYTGPWFGMASVVDPDTRRMFEQHNALLNTLNTAPESEKPALMEARTALETQLRQRLGSFADTSIERMVQDVVAQEARERYAAKPITDLSAEERTLLREKAKAAVKRLRGSRA